MHGHHLHSHAVGVACQTVGTIGGLIAMGSTWASHAVANWPDTDKIIALGGLIGTTGATVIGALNWIHQVIKSRKEHQLALARLEADERERDRIAKHARHDLANKMQRLEMQLEEKKRKEKLLAEHVKYEGTVNRVLLQANGDLRDWAKYVWRQNPSVPRPPSEPVLPEPPPPLNGDDSDEHDTEQFNKTDPPRQP